MDVYDIAEHQRTDTRQVYNRPFYDTRKQAFSMLGTQMRIEIFFFSILFFILSPIAFSLSSLALSSYSTMCGKGLLKELSGGDVKA